MSNKKKLTTKSKAFFEFHQCLIEVIGSTELNALLTEIESNLNLTDEEIIKLLKEWKNGYIKTKNPKFKTEFYKKSIQKINKHEGENP